MNHLHVGVFGLILGCLAGLLGAMILFVLMAAQTTPLPPPPPAPAAPGATLFLSEYGLSRLAAESLARPVVIDLAAGGRMEVRTRLAWVGLEPVVQLGFSLTQAGPAVVSRLDWLKFGFVKIPAAWLPREIIEAGSELGDSITGQIPPEFSLAGLATTPEGMYIYLRWTQ